MKIKLNCFKRYKNKKRALIMRASINQAKIDASKRIAADIKAFKKKGGKIDNLSVVSRAKTRIKSIWDKEYSVANFQARNGISESVNEGLSIKDRKGANHER